MNISNTPVDERGSLADDGTLAMGVILLVALSPLIPFVLLGFFLYRIAVLVRK